MANKHIADKIKEYQAICARHEASLLAVSKFKPLTDVLVAYEAGQRDFAENYVQELVEKAEQGPKDINWHFIGHLQSNKVKYIAPFVHLIHSVDSEKLLVEINKQAAKVNRVIEVLLQIDIADEETKFGLSEEEATAILLNQVAQPLNHIRIVGLMGMATNTDDLAKVASEFKHLASLKADWSVAYQSPNIELRELSMGMTQDIHEALAAGSTMVRIGTAIFGSRA